MRSRLMAFLLLSALVAGCSDSGSKGNDPQEADPKAFDEVEVTDTTGAIRGVVVNDAIAPIEGVLVAITGGAAAGQNRTSDAQGAFVFNNLEPGEYFLSASALGYNPVQSRATVVAGDKEPPVTKIQLTANPDARPFTAQQVWDGFLQCGFMAGMGSVGYQACGDLDDRYIKYFTLDSGIPTYAQADMTWASTQTLGTDLDLSFYDGETWYFKAISGTSPLMLNATGEEIEDWWTANATELPMRVFPGSSAPASVVYNQQFTVYMTFFYNFAPRQGWSFIVDGPCNQPSDCA